MNSLLILHICLGDLLEILREKDRQLVEAETHALQKQGGMDQQQVQYFRQQKIKKMARKESRKKRFVLASGPEDL